MGLGDLTRSAVERTLSEFDQLGRDAFLERYGFGRARAYFLERDGRHYDSKAIAGVAHQYLGPNHKPLRFTKFTGGEHGVARVLRRLGFHVINTEPINPDWVRDEL